jgi:putative FmdB family regulatory protein
MPIYEYVCKGCHKHFDLMLKISDQSPQTCPDCQSSNVERLVSAAGFQLKGSGWYATDFKNSSQAPANSCAKPECGTGNSCAANQDKTK